jgi:hypothetical protein
MYLKGDTSQYSHEFPQIVWVVATKKNSGDSLLSCELLRRWGDAMLLAIGMLAAAAGLVLGLRFSVITFVLLALAVAIVFAIGIWSGESPLVIALQMLATLAAVQISYLFGCLLAAHLPGQAKTPSGSAQTRHLRRLSGRTATR